MARIMDRLRAGSPVFAVERSGGGYVLVGRPDHRKEFNELVRELLNSDPDDCVILPVTDGGLGYERAIILPC